MSEYTPNLNLEKPNENELFNINTFNSNFDKIDEFITDKQSRNDIIYDDLTGNVTVKTDTSKYSAFKLFMMISGSENIYFAEIMAGINIVPVIINNTNATLIGNVMCSVTDNEISVSQFTAYEIMTGNTSNTDVLIKKIIGIK